MLRKILIAVFGAIFLAGCILMLRGRPDVEIGSVEVENNKTDILPIYFHVETKYKNNVSLYSTEGFTDVLDEIPRITQEVDKNAEGGMEIQTDINVIFKGPFCGDVFYTVFSEDGKVLEGKSKVLSLPAGSDVDSCVVQVDVVWGKPKNYEKYQYYFAVDFEYK